MSDADFNVVRNAGRPPPKPGRKSTWDYLPLSKLVEGDMIQLPMTEEDVRKKINAVRSYVSRTSKKLGCTFSVRSTAKGIEIWR